MNPVEFDWEKLNRSRDNILFNLLNDPKKLANTFYRVTKTGIYGFREIEIFSPYLEINDQFLCCTNSKLKVESLPEFCLARKVNPLNPQEELQPTRKNPRTLVIRKKEVQLDDLFLEYQKNPPSSLKYGSATASEVNSCLAPKIGELQYLAADKFTLEFLLGYIIDSIFEQLAAPYGLKNNLKYYGASICSTGNRSTGVLLVEYADLGNLKQALKSPNLASEGLLETRIFPVGSLVVVRDTYIWEILRQIVSSLDFLSSNFQMTFGGLIPSEILVQYSPLKYNYKGLKGNSPFTCKLGYWSRGGITLKIKGQNYRIYGRDTPSTLYFKFFSVDLKLGSESSDPYYLFQFRTEISRDYETSQAGVPFPKAWDFYSFLIGMLMIPEFYYPCFTNLQFRTWIWDRLFFPDQSNQVFNKLTEFVTTGKEPNLENISSVLNGTKLKCSVSDLMLSGLNRISE